MIRMLVVLILLVKFPDPTEIAKINRLKSEAEQAYLNGNYHSAAKKYSMLYDSMNVAEDEIALNLAHSYYALGDSANAKTNYQHLTSSANRQLKSVAYQQLGVLAKTPATLKQSLAYLKSALKANPANEEARYNYEVVKKLLKEQEQQQQEDQQNQQNEEQEDQQNQDQEKQEESDEQKPGEEGEQSEDQEGEKQESEQQEGEQGDEQEQQQPQDEGEETDEEGEEQNQMSTKQKLEEMNISEEKAQMILEAMKNNEIQYIQQQKRKSTQPRDSGKPDW